MNTDRDDPWHSDPWDQCVFVLSGTGQYVPEDPSEQAVNLGGDTGVSVLFVPANTSHKFTSDDGLKLFAVKAEGYPIVVPS